MVKVPFLLLVIFVIVSFGTAYFWGNEQRDLSKYEVPRGEYWLILNRTTNEEILYFGKPGSQQESLPLKKFKVKDGVSGKRPTPRPQLLGRDYWLVVDKYESLDNPETAPYFLQLDVPVTSDWPYGPVPYMECGGQCDWELPGYFGLHGVNGDNSRLSYENEGSSGCVRHSDEDIKFLFDNLDLSNGGVRYYVIDA